MLGVQISPIRAGVCAAIALSLALLTAYVVMQQSERLGANDPQVQLAEDAATALERGVKPANVIPSGQIDISRSLAPFVIVLDKAGRPVAASGTLGAAIPVPPKGVIVAVQHAGEERLTWAPQPAVRVASVIRRVDGDQPGFVVAGRSLREVEQNIQTIGRLLTLIWLCGVATLAIAVCLTVARGQRVAGISEGSAVHV